MAQRRRGRHEASKFYAPVGLGAKYADLVDGRTSSASQPQPTVHGGI